MDPCQFLRILIGNLVIKFPGSDPSSCCYSKIKFTNLPPQSSTITILSQNSTHPNTNRVQPGSVCFNLSKSDVESLITSKKTKRPNNSSFTTLTIYVYYGTESGGFCRFGSSKLLGRVVIPLELSMEVLEGRNSRVLQNGWVVLGGKKSGLSKPELYLSVEVQSDPRFVFGFDGEPECSPQVFQIQGKVKQPVFTCKFSCRQSGDWNSRLSSETSTSRSWLSRLRVDKDHSPKHQVKERKGWSITIHDLSGSPVAAASMVTPFVPSQGSDRVSRSNPGVWLILRPGDNTWIPWGRLESWRDRVGPGLVRLGHKFELIPEAGMSGSTMGPTGITLAHGSVPARSGGKFTIDISTGLSPSASASSSFDFVSWLGSGSGSGSASSSGSEPGPVTGFGQGWTPGFMFRGFVMSSTIGGEGKVSKPEVEIGSQHVTCTEDAAVFVALAAAMDLSVDACKPFSQKLRKELRQNSGEYVVV